MGHPQGHQHDGSDSPSSTDASWDSGASSPPACVPSHFPSSGAVNEDDLSQSPAEGAAPAHVQSQGEQQDIVLWLAVENEFLRRALRNDRETVAKLRAQLHTSRRALQSLHTQGMADAGHSAVEEQHRCIIAQLCNLDRLALDWARRCEALDGEARELCQLRVEHAQVLEASQALRAVHEATIHSLRSELASAHVRCKHANSEAATMLATLAEQAAALSGRADASQCELASIERKTDHCIVELEDQVCSMAAVLASLECVVPPRLLKLTKDANDGRTAQGKESEARKQRDVQVEPLRMCRICAYVRAVGCATVAPKLLPGGADFTDVYSYTGVCIYIDRVAYLQYVIYHTCDLQHT